MNISDQKLLKILVKIHPVNVAPLEKTVGSDDRLVLDGNKFKKVQQGSLVAEGNQSPLSVLAR